MGLACARIRAAEPSGGCGAGPRRREVGHCRRLLSVSAPLFPSPGPYEAWFAGAGAPAALPLSLISLCRPIEDGDRGPGTSRWASEFREPPQRGRSAASSRARKLAGCFPRTSPSSRSQVADLAGLGVSGSASASASASGRPRMVGQPPGRRRWLPTATRLLAPTPAGGLRATPGCPVVRRLTKRFVMTRLPRLLLVLVFFSLFNKK